MKVFLCKKCGIGIRRREDLRQHLFWHQVSDPNVDGYFTEEEREEEVAPVAAGAQPRKGVFGWLRRKET